MSEASRRQSDRDRAGSDREQLRRQGLRPIEIWVPDTHSPEFAAEAHLQSLVVAQSAHADEDQGFIEAITAPLTD